MRTSAQQLTGMIDTKAQRRELWRRERDRVPDAKISNQAESALTMRGVQPQAVAFGSVVCSATADFPKPKESAVTCWGSRTTLLWVNQPIPSPQDC